MKRPHLVEGGTTTCELKTEKRFTRQLPEIRKWPEIQEIAPATVTEKMVMRASRGQDDLTKNKRNDWSERLN